MTLIVDAAVAVAALVDDGPDGRWSEHLLAGDTLAAPHLMPVEAANILRRAALTENISQDVAALPHADLSRLRVLLLPYAPVAERVGAARSRHRLRRVVRRPRGGARRAARHTRPAPIPRARPPVCLPHALTSRRRRHEHRPAARPCASPWPRGQ